MGRVASKIKDEWSVDGSYAPACIKLLAQYKSLMKLVGDDIGGVEAFMRRFKVSTMTLLPCVQELPPKLARFVSLTDHRWTTQQHYIA